MRAGFLGNVTVSTPIGPCAVPVRLVGCRGRRRVGPRRAARRDPLLLVGAAEVRSARLRACPAERLVGTHGDDRGGHRDAQDRDRIGGVVPGGRRVRRGRPPRSADQRRDRRHRVDRGRSHRDRVLRRTTSTRSTTRPPLTIGTDNPAFPPWFAGTGTYGDWTAKPNSGTGNPAAARATRARSRTRSPRSWASRSDQVNVDPGELQPDLQARRPGLRLRLEQISYSPKRDAGGGLQRRATTT